MEWKIIDRSVVCVWNVNDLHPAGHVQTCLICRRRQTAGKGKILIQKDQLQKKTSHV